MKSEFKPYSLRKLADAYLGRELRPNPEYQRGTKWNQAQKQSLIDSLLRGYQIPLFYVHLLRRINAYTGTEEASAQLVDGQQRLAAIASYLQNEFSLSDPYSAAPGTVLPVNPPDRPGWNGKKFEELDPEDRSILLRTFGQSSEDYAAWEVIFPIDAPSWQEFSADQCGNLDESRCIVSCPDAF
jgi:Protein of unknown function DUF262